MNRILNNITGISAALILLLSAADLAPQTNTTGNKNSADVKKEDKAQDVKTSGTKDNDAKTGSKDDAGDKAARERKEKEDAAEKKKIEMIENTLRYGIQKDRKAAINSIRDVKDSAAQKKLISMVIEIVATGRDMEVRKTGITVIGDLKATEAGATLIKVLDDESEDIRIAACYAIGRLKISEAKPKLVELLKKQDMTVDSNFTDAIIMALDELGAPEIIQFAVETVKETKNSKMAREKLLLFIGKHGSKEQKDFLLEIYKDDEQEMLMRSYAVKSIAKLKITEASGEIKEIIKEIDSYPFSKKKKYYDLYIHSVAALAEMGDKDAIPLLMDSLRSDNSSVRLKAVNLIKDFNDERTIDILKYKMENDPSRAVRKAAKKALQEKGIIDKDKDSEEESKGAEEKDEADQENQQ